MSMLLLSTADSIYWLARQCERFICYENLYQVALGNKGHPRVDAQLFKECRSAVGAEALSYRDKQIPELLGQIESNAQQIRGVISQDAFELFHLIKRLSASGAISAAAFQIEACRAAMLTEGSGVSLFWKLGVQTERIDLGYRCGHNIEGMAAELHTMVQDLPANTKWQTLRRYTDRLTNSSRIDDFFKYQNTFAELIAEGI